jgi:hypothetical protein
MARKTDGEKIDELTKLVVALEEGLKAALQQVNAVYDAQSKSSRNVVGHATRARKRDCTSQEGG